LYTIDDGDRGDLLETAPVLIVRKGWSRLSGSTEDAVSSVVDDNRGLKLMTTVGGAAQQDETSGCPRTAGRGYPIVDAQWVDLHFSAS